MSRRLLRALCCAAAPAALFAFSAAQAADSKVVKPAIAKPGTAEDVLRYWTPERILSAKPMDLRISGKPIHGGQHRGAIPGHTRIVAGAPPTMAYDPALATELYKESQRPQHAIQPPLEGTGGKPYTTNRFYPQNDKKLYKVYPYATVGQLYFTETGGGNFVCTASVIRYSTIATAGHCVNDGNGTYWSNWLFVPAQNGSKAPLGKWTWTTADTTSAWYSGGGGVPNEQDDAIIVLATNVVKHGTYHIGDLTGYLGYEFDAPAPNSITQLGYPCNLDSCVDPIATYAQNNVAGTNNYEWGSAQAGGSSGGPQIQDFGQAPSGIPNETFGGNIVVSSTSYGYTDSSVQVQGGSIFYSPGQNGEFTFGDDLNYACSQGGC